MPTKTLDELRDLIHRALVNAGTAEASAAATTDALVAAEADGLRSHGLARVESYCEQVKTGKVDGKAVPVMSQPAKASIVVDAKSGFAFPAIKMGFERAVELVKETGVVCVAIRNSHHSGAFGYHVEALARKGLVCLGFSNSPAGIAPWGGKTPLFGTNPVGFGCPRKSGEPLIVDLSLAKVARGKIKLAADKGESIPEGWAVDIDGNPTTDAKAAMKGSNTPMGDAKGYALVLVTEILSAIMTGSHFGAEATSFFEAKGEPPHVGQIFIVFDPSVFAGDGFADRLEVLLGAILEQPGTRLPGDRRSGVRQRITRDGVQLDDVLLADLEARAAG
jgi:(2R)-3-sulfolactate dehydrogenase (NADP+)